MRTLTFAGWKPRDSDTTTVIEYTIKCSWCGTVIREGHSLLLSHGMCKTCERDWNDHEEGGDAA